MDEITLNLGKVFSETYESVKKKWLNLLIAAFLIIYFVIPVEGTDWLKLRIVLLFISITVYDIIKKTLREAEKEIAEGTFAFGELLNKTARRVKSDLIVVAISVFLIYRYVLPLRGVVWLQLEIVEMFLTITVFDILRKFFDSLEEELELE